MTPPSKPGNSRLTPAADATLDEYTREYRQQIFDEAVRLSSGNVLTPRDIVNAHDALEARTDSPRLARTAIALEERHDELRTMARAIWLGIAIVSSSVIAVLLLQFTEWSTNVWWIAIGGVVALAAGAFAVFLVGALERRRRSAREAMVALEEAEQSYANALEVNTNILRRNRDFRLPPDREDFNTRATFLFHWARLEERLRSLAHQALRMPPDVSEDYPIGPLLNDLTALGVIDEGTSNDIRVLLQLRNEVAHGQASNESRVRVGIDLMPKLERRLDDSIRKHTIK